MDHLLTNPDHISSIAILLALVAAWLHGDIYSKTSFMNVKEEKDELRKIIFEANARDRAELERVKTQLEKALGPKDTR